MPSEAWPQGWDGKEDELLERLLASVDQHRSELERRLTTDLAVPPVSRRRSAKRAAASRGLLPAKLGATASPTRLRFGFAAAVRFRSFKLWLVAAAALVIVVAGVAGISALGGSTSTPHPNTASRSAPRAVPDPSTTSGPATSPSLATQGALAQAAAWIAAEVGPGHVVACDVSVCALLRGHGFPAASLVTVQSQVSDVEQADLVVVTDVIRQQLGTALAGVTGTEPLAVFAAGSSSADVRTVALSGPGDYASRLAADRKTRQAAGAALLGNHRIAVTGKARTLLSDGLVDSRVCALLAVLGGSHRVTVSAFTGSGPGAGPDVPYPGVVISAIDGAAGGTAQAATLSDLIAAQRPPYAPLSVTPITSGPNPGLAIVFAEPSPLGLLGAPAP